MQRAIDGGVVLITGASSGLGSQFAIQLAPRAKALILVARRTERLEKLRTELVAKHPNLEVVVESCDLADREKTDAMLANVERKLGPVDVLINNAGFGDLGVFDHTDWAKTEQMITLNVTTLTYLTRRLVASMVARKKGGILNVSSGYGLAFGPGMAAYIGTKHYVTAFTEALRIDLAGTGVAVTQVCPGPVRTEFLDTVGNFLERDPPSFMLINADKCVRVAIRALDRNRAMIVPGLLMTILIWIGNRTPRWIMRLASHPLAVALRKKQLEVEAAKLPGKQPAQLK